ncbi:MULTISPECIES: hypothetical protein [Bacillus]|uniref:hypothetical protein n=1 Tax=Bacillus TaxID=1386 RepID=UPI002E1B4552|nr:hypothetical protein [Bacillus smithii]
MKYGLHFLVAVLVLVFQYLISKRGHVLVGAILPLLYIGFFIYAYMNNIFPESSGRAILAALLGGTVLLVSGWIKGRESLSKKRKKELEKIKAKDL